MLQCGPPLLVPSFSDSPLLSPQVPHWHHEEGGVVRGWGGGQGCLPVTPELQLMAEEVSLGVPNTQLKSWPKVGAINRIFDTALVEFLPKMKNEEVGTWEVLRRSPTHPLLAGQQGNQSNTNTWLVLLIQAVDC